MILLGRAWMLIGFAGSLSFDVGWEGYGEVGEGGEVVVGALQDGLEVVQDMHGRIGEYGKPDLDEKNEKHENAIIQIKDKDEDDIKEEVPNKWLWDRGQWNERGYAERSERWYELPF